MAILITEPLAAAWPEPDHPSEQVSLALLRDGGDPLDIPLIASEAAGDGLTLEGRAHGFLARMRWRPRAAPTGQAYDVDLAMVCLREPAEPLAVQVRLALDASSPLHWMIPGLFYDRPLEPGAVRYPRIGPGDGGDSLQSESWIVPADRASHPTVMAIGESCCTALIAGETATTRPAAIGFDAHATAPALLLAFPAIERPFRYTDHGEAHEPEPLSRRFRAGEIVALSFGVRLLDGDPHAYDIVLREIYQRAAPANPLRPWITVEVAAQLAAHGLYTWHFRPDTGVLAETVAFEAEHADRNRDDMHVAWLSGAPSAHALLAYGRERRNADYIRAGIAVLDRIAGGIAPCGAFWDRWTPAGWRTGWNRDPRLLHARTTAEATLFMHRALVHERCRGVDHPGWEAAVRSNLRHALLTQGPDGAFASYVDAHSGAVADWRGAAGMLWIAALVEARDLLDDGIAVEAAARAGESYARFIEAEQLLGAPEDVHLAPSSEDGYNAVISYLALFLATGSRGWLQLAGRAADWTMSFRFAANLEFSSDSMLGRHAFRTRGADLASPVNQHLHAYGLIALPEMLRLAHLTGDTYYRERTRDNLACFLQFVARHDGDFGARQGMVSERYHHTDWAAPKGDLLPVSHAWSAGLLLYACLWAMRDPEGMQLPPPPPPD
jgi:hypothetical protein